MTSSHEGHAPTSYPAARPEPDSAEARVSAGLSALDSLGGSRPLSEHAPVYDGLHQNLQAVLAEIDGA